MTYADLSRRSQIRRMRGAARLALADYGLEDADLRVVNHDFNTTFRVTAVDGRRAALRINVNSRFGPDEVAAEAEWVGALGRESDVGVPPLIPTLDGRAATSTACPGIDRPLAAILYGWIEGRDLGQPAPIRGLEALGRSAALLHNHAEGWRSPAIARRPDQAMPLMGEPDRLTVPDRRITAARRSVLTDALAMITDRTAAEFAQPGLLVHADLHVWNARWHRGELTVFDFDDCGLGTRLQDLAISAYYLRDQPGAEEALLRGYEQVRPLPDHDPEVFEALVASRNLLLLNDVLENVTADMADFLPGYIQRTVARMRRYLKSGRFEL